MSNHLQEIAKKIEDMPLIAKGRLWGLLEDDKEKQARLKPIEQHFSNKRDRIIEIYEVGDEFQIVKYETTWAGEKEVRFKPFYQFKSSSFVCDSLEIAMITAIAIKHDDYHAVGYACRVLNVPMDEE